MLMSWRNSLVEVILALVTNFVIMAIAVDALFS